MFCPSPHIKPQNLGTHLLFCSTISLSTLSSILDHAHDPLLTAVSRSADINITQIFCRIIVQQRCLGAECLSWIWWNSKITIFSTYTSSPFFPPHSPRGQRILQTHKAKQKGTQRRSNVTVQRADGIHSLPLIFFLFCVSYNLF